MPAYGKWLFFAGLAVATLGLVLWLGGRWFGWLGRLPGDIRIEGDRGGIYFPLITCIVLSLVLTAVVAIIRRLTGG